jgi:hypothetical protein
MRTSHPSRITTVHVEHLGEELCVYDWKRKRVHTLSPMAASVWLRCNGDASPTEIAARLQRNLKTSDIEALVHLALDELKDARLLEGGARSVEYSHVSRRELLRRLGKAAALVPVITSIAAPAAVDAQSASSRAFEYAGAAQTFIVPGGVTQIAVTAYGAEGGGSISAGGHGGFVTATIPVTPGETLTVSVGGKPPDALGYFIEPVAGGFNGGGGSAGCGAGGGGASDVRRGSTKLVVAGGGGGTANGGSGRGGAGGGTTGADGAPGCGDARPGAGGSQISGGAGGTAGLNGLPGTVGSAGSGGEGGRITGSNLVGGGGGGGGGFFGGGGGGGGWSCSGFQSLGSGGGGGGSSYTDPAATNVSHTQGARSGNGLIVLSWT